MAAAAVEDNGKLEYGCEHYRRRCKLVAPCCNKVFSCRHCHNDAVNASSDPKDHHQVVRHEVQKVVCAVCDTEQQVADVCTNCGVKMGEYFCEICKFYDDDTTKEQFHCDDCGICRVGGRDNYFHCQKCGSCYRNNLQDNHSCVENSLKNHCPICYEFLFDSVKCAQVMKCGHTMHMECYVQLINQNQHRCPICSKSLHDFSTEWRQLDRLIADTEMPEEYRYQVRILCNDCNKFSNVSFHFYGHKCSQCQSYNTRMIGKADDHH